MSSLQPMSSPNHFVEERLFLFIQKTCCGTEVKWVETYRLKADKIRKRKNVIGPLMSFGRVPLLRQRRHYFC